MKKKEPYYLNYYFEWLQGGLPNGWGICIEFWCNGLPAIVTQVSPTAANIKALKRQHLNHEYWGSDSHLPLWGDFTPLRQNLVLLMAALNNEL